MSIRRRRSKTIGFKAFHDADQDILTWWEEMPEGERSQVLRDLIRAAMAGQGISSPSNGHNANSFQLTQVCEDTAWIRNALSDLPAYLDRLVGQVAATRQVPQAVVSEEPQDDGPRLEQDAIERRKTKMRQNVW
jgi:hypothetical protein